MRLKQGCAHWEDKHSNKNRRREKRGAAKSIEINILQRLIIVIITSGDGRNRFSESSFLKTGNRII